MVQNYAADIKVRCERKLGELTREREKNEGGRPVQSGNIVLPVIEIPEVPATYAELGLDGMAVSGWQPRRELG